TLEEGFYYWFHDHWEPLKAEILDNTVVYNDGDQSFSYIDQRGEVHEIYFPGEETLTKLDYDPEGNTLTYKDENGDEVTYHLGEVIAGDQTLTILNYNPDTHELTYEDEDHKSTTLPLNMADIRYDKETNTIVYTNEIGEKTALELNKIEVEETLTKLDYDEKTNILTY